MIAASNDFINKAISKIQSASIRKTIKRLFATANDYKEFAKLAHKVTPEELEELFKLADQFSYDRWLRNQVEFLINDIQILQKENKKEGIREADLEYTGFFDLRQLEPA
jgi:hypothetical protein